MESAVNPNILVEECKKDTYSQILIFSICGQIGSGLTLVRRKIAQALASYGYECVIVDVSQVVLELFFDKLNLKDVDNSSPEYLNSDSAKRIYKLQRRGNILREKYGSDIVSRIAVSHVIWPRINDDEKESRVAYLVDSLKHHEEVNYLRNLLGDAYYSIGVISTDSVRKNRLKSRKGFSEDEFIKLSEIDAKEKGLEYGQSTVKAITQSDYFFSNDYSTADHLDSEAQRLLRLIFSVGVDTPRVDEYGISVANNAAKQSGCLAKQVGASVINASGQLMATGRNDVPQYGGGLYTSESEKDDRCWARSGQCYNDIHKLRIIDELTKELTRALSLEKENQALVREKLAYSRISSLIEFSRAVHAEMDALIAIARSGIPGLIGATLYCTTFPCHNCAKHIIDAGILRVVYLEPYEKSLARELHPDTIKNPADENDVSKIPFEAFGGVAPRRYNQLFGINRERKERPSGKYIDLDPERQSLIPIGAQDDEIILKKIEKAASILGAVEYDNGK